MQLVTKSDFISFQSMVKNVYHFSDDSIEDIEEGHSGDEDALHEEEEEILAEADNEDEEIQDEELEDPNEEDPDHITVEIDGEEYVVNKMEESLL